MDAFIIAFSMYSKIPMPRREWTSKGMKYAICFFPVVGMVIGLIVELL
ncbi:MAG: adenosylcobinamide-GDP ribazoletransferase, partial [Lachnospiraceae bacterium]|nr:adenosylcobinamide-GDP ribazoletransferase [Lachnospiraceae bacterium]MBQ2320736.1 adenosylcobinamide-GDP ribazoletransferase [Lachnospiraceae bacterium]